MASLLAPYESPEATKVTMDLDSKVERVLVRQNKLTFAGIYEEYAHGVPNPGDIAPESYTLDAALIERPDVLDIQLDVFPDYQSNAKLYPKFQAYFRELKRPLSAIGGNMMRLLYEAFRRDNPNATVELLETGHFALETHVDEIAASNPSTLTTVKTNSNCKSEMKVR
jgi:hypothetical protein